MKVVKNDNKNNSLTLAEMEAIQQFEASHRAGQAAPTCMVFCEEVGRFGITILEGRYSFEEARTEDEQWYRHEADGMRTPIDNPLEGAWQAAAEVREELKRKLDLKLYTIAVGWFPDMEPDEDILDAAAGRSAHPLFGRGELVQRLVKLPNDKEMQPQLRGGYIKQETTVLSRASTAGAAAAPAGGGSTVGEGAGRRVGPGASGDRRHHYRQRWRWRRSFDGTPYGAIGAGSGAELIAVLLL